MFFPTNIQKSRYWKKIYFPKCNRVSINKFNGYVRYLMENKIMKLTGTRKQPVSGVHWKCYFKIFEKKMRDSLEFWQNIWKILLKVYRPNPDYFTKKELLQRYLFLRFCLLFSDIYFKELLWIAASEERKFQTSRVNNIKTKHM